MNIGWIGKKEINQAIKDKEFRVARKKTKAKSIAVIIDEKPTLTENDIFWLAKASGIDKKLCLSDMNMLIAFCNSVILASRGGYDNIYN